MSNVVIPVIVGAVCAAVFAVLGFVLGVAHRRKTAEKEIGSATQEATKIINNALAEAEASKKEKVLEAKDEVHKLRSDADRDIRERRNEVQRQEKRLNQREEYLDKKADSLEAKNDKISEKQKELENKLLEVDGIKKSQFDMLERISGLTQEEAKNQLLASLEEELDTEVKIFQNALDFSSIKIRDCIVPRTEVVAVDLTTSLDELKNRFIESGISKIIVYDGNIDNVVGYIHSSEMFRAPKDWHDNVKDVPIVPETMSAHKLMKLFMLQKKTIAVVVDEFGGTSGIVSLEDLVEEIFGDIEDEHDNTSYISKKIDENEYKITCVGEEAPVTLAGLGHCTIRFNGMTEAELPGTLYVEEKAVPEIKVGTTIQIIE